MTSPSMLVSGTPAKGSGGLLGVGLGLAEGDGLAPGTVAGVGRSRDRPIAATITAAAARPTHAYRRGALRSVGAGSWRIDPIDPRTASAIGSVERGYSES